MKKIIVSSLLAISVLVLVACGGNVSNTTTTQQTQNTTAQTTSQPVQNETSASDTSQNVGSGNEQDASGQANTFEGYYTFGDVFILDNRRLGKLEVTIGEQASFLFSIDSPLEEIDGRDVIMIPIRIENTGDGEAMLSEFFTPLGGMNYNYPSGERVNHRDNVAINAHFRVINVTDETNPRFVPNPDFTVGTPGGYPYRLPIGEVIHRHIYMLYDGDGDYILNITGGTNIRFPISRN